MLYISAMPHQQPQQKANRPAIHSGLENGPKDVTEWENINCYIYLSIIFVLYIAKKICAMEFFTDTE